MSKSNYIAWAEETLAGHQYTCLALKPDLEVWRCKKPNTCNWAFDIFISRFGIAVVGDITPLTFSVGSTYGMEFLAGNDVGYYIHSKLESECRTEQFSMENLQWHLGNAFAYWLEQNCQWPEEEYDEDGETLNPGEPAFVIEQGGIDAYHKCKALLEETTEEQWLAWGGAWTGLTNEIPKNKFKMTHVVDWKELFENIADVSSAHEAHTLLNENFHLNHWEFFDMDLNETCPGLLRRLYLVNSAAKRIVAIKEANAKRWPNRFKKWLLGCKSRVWKWWDKTLVTSNKEPIKWH